MYSVYILWYVCIYRFMKYLFMSSVWFLSGDGTHRGANALSEECIKRNLNIAVAGIPKTIDNDVDLIDRLG